MLRMLRRRRPSRRHFDIRLRGTRSLVMGGAAALMLCAGLVAATPTFWTVSTQSDFLKGDVEDLSIDSDGRMFPGPSASLVAETAAPFLWTVVAGTDGTLWAGSGNEGQVLKVSKDGKVSTFFDAPELEVHALASAILAIDIPITRATTSRRRKPTPTRAGPASSALRPERGDFAGRQDLSSRRRRHLEDILRSGRQVHLGARGR